MKLTATSVSDDPVALAHIIEVDTGALAIERKPLVLLDRLNGNCNPPIIPGETAMLEAKRILNADMEQLAGELEVDIGKSTALKPAAVKKKGKR